MARWRFVTSPLIEREFTRRGEEVPRTKIDTRLRALTSHELVEWERVLAGVPRLYWLTRSGMSAASVQGAAPTPKLSDIRHDLTVIDVAHWLSTYRVPSHTLVTEREIRRTETPNQFAPERKAVYSIVLHERATHTRAYPDLVSVNDTGRAFGHEVEYSRKDHRRLVRLMLGYVESPVYAGAVYYAAGETSDGVKRAAAEANRIAVERTGRAPITVMVWPGDVPEDQRP
jgi:hypothetical protein